MSSFEEKHLCLKCKQEVPLVNIISVCPQCAYVALRQDCLVSINVAMTSLTKNFVKYQINLSLEILKTCFFNSNDGKMKFIKETLQKDASIKYNPLNAAAMLMELEQPNTLVL